MQEHWSGYLKAVGEAKPPNTTMPTVAPFETSSYETGKTSFMDLLVGDNQKKIQARYDAMSRTWEGVDATDKAVMKGTFKTESMPVNKK